MGLPSTIAHDGDGTGDELQLVVVEQDGVAADPVPSRGEVLVGRGADVGVSLSDPGASAQQPRVYVDGSVVMIEELGSRNGTQVRDQRLEVGQRVRRALGEA